MPQTRDGRERERERYSSCEVTDRSLNKEKKLSSRRKTICSSVCNHMLLSYASFLLSLDLPSDNEQWIKKANIKLNFKGPLSNMVLW